MKCEYYILDDEHHAVPTDTRTWALFFEDINKRRVKWTDLGDGVYVSTVFLGLDHRFFGEGPPLLFETIIFGGALDQQMWRYSSWDDAVVGHDSAVRKAKS